MDYTNNDGTCISTARLCPETSEVLDDSV
jgi:hypothetical protein